MSNPPPPEGREFPLGSVLTVISGIALAPVGEIHELLDYMTGDVLMTHQLGRALTECQPDLASQHPELASISLPRFDGEHHVRLWVTTLIPAFGPTRVVRPLPEGVHARLDPIAELVHMMNNADASHPSREGG